jgi:hypothetical protein
LKGAALHKFLLQKIGVSWEQQIVPNATLDDIDEDAVKRFLQAALLLFGKRPKKYAQAAYFKIGRFGRSHSDLMTTS